MAVTATGDLLGWVAASPVSARPVYRGVIEHSIYVRLGAHSRGIGAALLDALIGSTEADGIWTIQTGIFPENQASLRLHQRAGFRVVGTRDHIGRHYGHWRDVTLLERRSIVTFRYPYMQSTKFARANTDGAPGHVGLVIDPARHLMVEAYATGFPLRVSQFGTPASAAGEGIVVGFTRWSRFSS